LFGDIVRKAAQHVKSNQGGSEFRGEKTTIVLKSALVLCRAKDPKKTPKSGIMKLRAATTKKAVAQIAYKPHVSTKMLR
jgi:hypothetical protein